MHHTSTNSNALLNSAGTTQGMKALLHSYRMISTLLLHARLRIKSPQFKNQIIAKTRLANGIKTCLISDPTLPVASAAISIDSGSWKDNSNQMGVAHFLEHMCFLGSKAYPNENDFESFIRNQNGSFNAYTSSDHTLYYFNHLNPLELSGALDRLSRFFYEPLFDESSSDRERNAVDQEFKKNIQQDGWRKHHVMKHLARKSHPFSMFNTGNLETMKLIDIDYLRKWHLSNYTANLMNICIMGRESIGQLEAYAEKYFSPIPTGHQKQHVDETVQFQHIFPETLNESIVWIKPLKELKELTITYEVPFDLAANYDTKPGKLLGFIIGDESKGSLLSHLKKLELVQGLSAGSHVMGGKNVSFEVSVSLTEKGLLQWRNVVSIIYSSFDKIGKSQFPRHIFDELNKMSIIDWQFQQRSNNIVSDYAAMMREESLETFPEKSLLISKFDPDAVIALAKYLVPSRSFITLVSQITDKSVDFNLIEPWMQVEYGKRKWTQDEQNLFARNVEIPFEIPAPNRFLPQDLEILDSIIGKQSTIHPTIVKSDKTGIMHYFRDDTFLVPKAVLKFNIKTQAIRPNNARSICLASLYQRFVDERLNEISYEASSAGLNAIVSVQENTGISISVDGYSQNCVTFLKEVVDIVMNLALTINEFDVFKESLLRRFRNATKNSPVLSAHMMKEFSTTEDLATALNTIEYEDLVDYSSNELYASTYVEGFAGGNISEADAESGWNAIQKIRKGRCDPAFVQKSGVVAFDSGTPQYLQIDHQVLGNSLVWLCEVTKGEVLRGRVAYEIMSKLINEPFYSELRTKQQTGYIVSSSIFRKDKRLFFNAAIQSNTHDPRDLLARVELFIETFLRNLKDDANMLTRFEAIKAAMLVRLAEPFDTLDSKLHHLNYIAYEEDCNWTFIEQKMAVLRDFEFAELRHFAIEVLGRGNKRRVAVLGRGNGAENRDFTYAKL